MYIRLVNLGDGSEGSPNRVDLPNYTALDIDETNGTMTVNVPARQCPPSCPPVGSVQFPIIDGRPVLIGLSDGQLEAWWKRLAMLYPTRSPAYMPALV